MSNKKLAGAAALGVAYLATRGGADTTEGQSAPEQPAEETEEQSGPVETWEPATAEDEVVEEGNTADEGEVGVSDNGVVYDDPETGEYNDEPEDDANATFEDVQTVGEATDSGPLLGIEPESYAPDVQDGSEAPSDEGGVIADPGDSQEWGSAPEQENDDLTEQAADSELDDDMKSAFDALANFDDPDNL